jgi:hypothetical protein
LKDFGWSLAPGKDVELKYLKICGFGRSANQPPSQKPAYSRTGGIGRTISQVEFWAGKLLMLHDFARYPITSHVPEAPS